jgi:predicted nucleotidyltransferase
MEEKIELILNQSNLLRFFTQAFIFGSVIRKNKTPSDIDLLLVYQDYSGVLLAVKKEVEVLLFENFELYADITMLSSEELEQTEFLEKLKLNYMRIK